MMRWICAVGLLLCAACSAVPSVPVHQQSRTAAIQVSGGAFSSNHSGSLNTNGGCSPPDGNGEFKFSGKGPGSFIGRNFESGSMVGDPYVGCHWSGSATMTSSAHPRSSITVALSQIGYQSGWPCVPRFGQMVKWSISSGTGKFASAKGNGTIKFTCKGYSTYTDQWAGTITF